MRAFNLVGLGNVLRRRAAGLKRVEDTSEAGWVDGRAQFKIFDKNGGIVLVTLSQYKEPN